MLKFFLFIIYQFYKIKHGEYPLSVLYYHHVFATKNLYHPDDLSVNEFEGQINFLNNHFNVLPMKDAIRLLKQGKLPPKALVISFDDGYKDNYTNAVPILDKFSCSATFFISTEGVDKGYLWNDIIEQCIKQTDQTIISAEIIGKAINIETNAEKISAYIKLINHLKFKANKERSTFIEQLKCQLDVFDFQTTMMNPSQIRSLHNNNFEIGAHTHSHTILSTESDEDCYKELEKNKNKLQNIINQPINYLAFPNGLFQRDFNEKHCTLAKKTGFKSAFSTNDGGALSSTNTYAIPRFMPYRKQLTLFALSIAKIAGEHD